MNINGTTIRRGAVAVIAGAAALGALTACGESQQGQAAAPGNVTQAGSVVSTEPSKSSAPPTSAHPAPAASSAERAPGGADKGKPPANGGTAECTKMKVSTQALPPATGQEHIALVFTNQGSAPCTVRGFPGVRLDGTNGQSWDLVRTGDEILPVEVAPGQHVTANLSYLDSYEADRWPVARMAVTPPHTTDTQTVPWPSDRALVLQDGATHPGTFIAPIRK
ncbi:DUF4232 domain-containing protein [Amycolatopsis minnesotensis]|uniref:DUF4232 domain-containing protein n=1 Tax=Amycolatopsis minnesotensis TaxID=337894 RepID=A0ABN2QPG7_9PSEU